MRKRIDLSVWVRLFVKGEEMPFYGQSGIDPRDSGNPEFVTILEECPEEIRNAILVHCMVCVSIWNPEYLGFLDLCTEANRLDCHTMAVLHAFDSNRRDPRILHHGCKIMDERNWPIPDQWLRILEAQVDLALYGEGMTYPIGGYDHDSTPYNQARSWLEQYLDKRFAERSSA